MRWLVGLLVCAVLASVAAPLARGQEPGTTGNGVTIPTGAESPAAPSDQPSPESPAGSWVATHQPTELWSDSEGGVSFGPVRRWTYLQWTGLAADGRLYVFNPRTSNYAWVDAAAVGPVPAPSPEELRGPQVVEVINKPGRTLGGYNLRSWPSEAPETRIRPLAHNVPVTVYEAVLGDDGEIWYRIGDDEYVHHDGVRLPRPPEQTFPGRWIDADLQEPALLTAYEGDQVVYTALAIKGSLVSPTPLGVHRILRRVYNETMDSSTIGIPRNGPGGYYLRNVLYTQYFHSSGAAIHYNYWRGEFGYAGSHGCLGLNLEDSRWFWDWANIGTIVYIHQ
ncbi:MAG TPA: L,D-transpeptidase [Chloroflexota bacterium]|nr:L,D-transpeptidase [Chloroflexota bacterium]